ncbi:hypothetical protein Tco_0858245 [Tanacetum coccineum]|uniref:Uncharacterized protein n=1 Tax=Tanacetum coccineum TaxID=301880 RepID=A0ABQ5BBK4_9ASTR
MKKDNSIENNEVVDNNVIEPSELNEVEPIEEEMEDGTDNKSVGGIKEELTRGEMKVDIQVEMPRIGLAKADEYELFPSEDGNGPHKKQTPDVKDSQTGMEFSVWASHTESRREMLHCFLVLEFVLMRIFKSGQMIGGEILSSFFLSRISNQKSWSNMISDMSLPRSFLAKRYLMAEWSVYTMLFDMTRYDRNFSKDNTASNSYFDSVVMV